MDDANWARTPEIPESQDPAKNISTKIPRRLRNLFLIVLVVIAWALTNACFRAETPRPPVELEDFHFKPRISRNNQPVDLHPGRTFWLRKGEELEVRYKTFETHWQRGDTPCAFDDNTSTDECTICDYCSTYGPGFCTTMRPAIPPYDALLSYDSLIVGNGTQFTVLDRLENNGYSRGCPNSTDPKTVIPSVNSTLRFMSPTEANVAIGEGKILVLTPGQITTVAYQMTTPATLGLIDGKKYWTWNVRSDRLRPIGDPPLPALPGDELWSENFSPNLRVTDVRILKGICGNDPLTGNCIPQWDATLLQSAVMPAKVVFLPNYNGTVAGNLSEANHVCYPDPAITPLGSFVNLDFCRTRNNGTPPIARLATPTYDLFEQFSLARLTWAVAFDNVDDASDSDLTTGCDRTTRVGCEEMLLNQDLIIEFTLKAQ